MTTYINKPCVTFGSDSGSVSGLGDGVPVLILMLGQIFLISCFKWPFVVYGESGRWLNMISSLRPAHVERWKVISLMNVEGAGLKHAALRNWVNLFWFYSFRQWNYLMVQGD